ncbi:MAG: 50S ribosomal protein L23 [Bacteroidetes bacterium HGW-Bacteroidetes-20]|nr:MAG: 50S ribosomal protein L23 [Bacteroidetes bacterium HGW-Bacteroidetes-20]
MNVLIKPIISEKMQAVSEKFNRYGFIVDRKASKTQIRKAVEDTYGVKVEKVNTLIQRGKSTTRITKARAITGQKNTVKKAIIFVNSKDKIDFYSNI